FLFGVSLLGLVGTVFLFSKQNKKIEKPDRKSSAFMKQEYGKQMALKNQWRDSLGEIDSMQARFQEQVKIRDSHLNGQKLIIENWEVFLREHQLPEELLFSDAETIIEDRKSVV